MPELPEVETMCRGVAAAVGCRIDAVERPRSRLHSIIITPQWSSFRRAAVGKTITAVRRAGKKVVLELGEKGSHPRESRVESRETRERTMLRPHPTALPAGAGTSGCYERAVKGLAYASGYCIVIEPRMTGLVLLREPPNRKHLRLVFRLSGGDADQLLFWDQRGLGVVRLLSAEQFARHYGPERLGPDALKISTDGLRKQLCASRRAIKVALLDQRALAGVGNLYASEILHQAGIHPAVTCCDLQPSDWSRLHAAMREVLKMAIRHQGSTLRDGTYRVGRDKNGNYQAMHRVYQRAGERCLTCDSGEIARVVQAQRSTFFCPRCQRSCITPPSR